METVETDASSFEFSDEFSRLYKKSSWILLKDKDKGGYDIDSFKRFSQSGGITQDDLKEKV